MSYKASYLLILFFLIGVDYIAGLYISKAKKSKRTAYLILSILANLGILFYFKYFNFVFDSINYILTGLQIHRDLPQVSLLLPLGLSFHTFQSMSYTIEVYRKKQKPEKNLLNYALYVMFFPQLVAGPIERPQHLLKQFRKKHKFNYHRMADGLKLMAWGFFKKLVIADRLALFINPIYNNNPTAQPGVSFIIATIFFSYQIYCDFSGYSDIAIGSAKVLGINLVQNFNSPYFSLSPSEFWRRWHISLSSWLRDYVYIPLGGSRVPFYRWSINVLITFTLSGLWHGANWTFVIWGLLHGAYIVTTRTAEEAVKKIDLLSRILKKRIFSIFKLSATFTMVSFAWIFFRSTDVTQANYIATHLFKGIDVYTVDIFQSAMEYEYIPLQKIFEPILITTNISDVVIVVVAIIIMEIAYLLQKNGNMWNYVGKKPIYIRWTIYSLLIWAIIIFGQFGKQQFIYFAF